MMDAERLWKQMTTFRIDYKKLRNICLADEKHWIPDGSNYYFKDNDSKILAVAHLDYVSHGKPDFVAYKYKGVNYVQSETLDDRLGVYIITEILPSLGVNVDILLTTDEEVGNSTAILFETDKKYNWIMSFDRHGTDVVAYDYKDPDLSNLLFNATGKKFEWGSFSDIVYLEHLGVKGINWGAGYHNEHTESCWASEREIIIGVNNFMKFYRSYKDTRLEHHERVYVKSNRGGGVGYSRGGVRYEDENEYEVIYSKYPYLNSGEGDLGYDDEKDISYSNNGEAIGECDYCGWYGTLLYHFGLDAYVCPDCNEGIRNGEDMDELTTPRYCQMCTVDDITGGELREYTLPYTGEVVLVCEYCEHYLDAHSGDEELIRNYKFHASK